MNIKCLFGHHVWRFAYNHGISLGTSISMKKSLDMLHTGESYPVDRCTRCGKQSRMVGGVRVMLTRSEVEEP